MWESVHSVSQPYVALANELLEPSPAASAASAPQTAAVIEEEEEEEEEEAEARTPPRAERPSYEEESPPYRPFDVSHSVAAARRTVHAADDGDGDDDDGAEDGGDASSDLEYWQLRARSLEARCQAASEARRSWQLREAEYLERIDVLEAQGGGAGGSPTSAAGAPELVEEEAAAAEVEPAAATPAPTRREGVPRTRIDFMSPDGIF